MNEQATCPECGKPLPEGSSHDLCPACLMGQVMASRTFDTSAGNETTTPPPTPEEIADKFPQFEVVECLGRGGMGVVYKARQKSLDRWVAIKVLAPERVHEERFAEHFEREAKTLAKMSHPNIVTVYDHGQTDGLFYIVMEFVDGLNLRDLLREAKIEPEQALAIIPPICDALEYAHDKGVVHRDIKPENILLDRDGRVKIADFGIASLVGVSGEKSGTPPYMAPEQANGIVDRRADIYALGAVLYEMLTGERPNKELVAPSKKVQIDVRLDQIVLRALEKTPALRYQTAGEFRTQVETMVSSPHRADAAKPVRPDIESNPSVSSRFSRTAIVGACWAPLFFVAFVLFFTQDQASAGVEQGPPWWLKSAILAAGVLGLTAPFGTTILGWMSVSQIRRSAGKLHGLWLAVLDGLLFPLLALTGLIGWFWHWVFYDLMLPYLIDGNPQLSPLERLLVTNINGLTLLPTLATSLIVGFFIIRRVWRLVNPSLAGAHPNTAPAASRPLNRTALAVGLGIMVLCIFGTQMVLNHLKQGDRARDITPPDQPVVTQNLSFGPVNERELFSNESLAQAFLDLDTGTILSAPPEIESQLTQGKLSTGPHDSIIRAWMRSSGADLVPQAINPPMLTQADGHAGRLVLPNGKPTISFESVTPAEVESSLGNYQSVKADPSSENVFHYDPSSCSTFVTREGAKGILEITRMDGRSVKLRYKLVKGSPEPSANADSIDTAQRPLVTYLASREQVARIESLLKSVTFTTDYPAAIFVQSPSKDAYHLLDGVSVSPLRALEIETPGSLPLGEIYRKGTEAFFLKWNSAGAGYYGPFTTTPEAALGLTKLDIRSSVPAAPATPTFESVTDAAKKLIAKYFPEAVITATEDEFKAQHDTREYEIHGNSKTGEVAQKARMETGPTTKGFRLTVRRQNEIGQAEMPQFFDRPYWKTYGNLAIDPQTGLGVAVYFDFGAGLNPEFKAAMLELLKLAGNSAPKPTAAAAPAKPDAIIFDPVLERVVNDPLATREKAALRFDSGELVSIPDYVTLTKWGVLPNGPDVPWDRNPSAWARSEHVDAMAYIKPNDGKVLGLQCGLLCPETLALRAADNAWEQMTPEALTKFIKEKDSERSPVWGDAILETEGKFPATFLLLNTRTRRMGMVQIIGVSEKPAGVKIRYRMIHRTGKPVLNAAWTFESVKTEARKLISMHFPEAVVTADTEKEFKIQHGTREYEFPSVGDKMRKKTGPDAKGFMLSLRRTSVDELDALATPQILKEYYGETFANKVIDPQTGKGASVFFSYAAELDAGFKAAMLELLSFSGSGATKPATAATFGQVIERVVNDPHEFDDAKSLLLDTADWEKMPAEELVARMAGAEKIDIRSNGNAKPYVDLSVALAALIADGKPTTPLPQSLIWAFKPLLGAAGILQVTGFTQNPRGVKIRIKLVQAAQAKPDAATNAATPPSFGPVIEHEFNHNNQLLDLDIDSGSFLVPPQEIKPAPGNGIKWSQVYSWADVLRVPDSVNGVVRSEWSYPEFVAWKNALREWEEKSGGDLLFGQELVGDGYEKVTLMLTGGLAIERLDPDGGFTWDSPPANLMERFALLTPRYHHSPINETIEFNNINFRPGLFLFKTREGNRGLLQIILDKSKIGQGFKVRYMLVKMADAAPSSDRSSNPSSPPDKDRMGTLGYSLGTYLTIEGVRAEEGKVGTQTLMVDTIGGNKLDQPIGIWIENVELPKGERCVFKGYETGEWNGVPDEVLRATGAPRPQAGWQERFYFIATSVEQPGNLKLSSAAPSPTPLTDPTSVTQLQDAQKRWAEAINAQEQTLKEMAMLAEKKDLSAAERETQERKIKSKLHDLESEMNKLQTLIQQHSPPPSTPVAPDTSEASELKGQKYLETFRAPLQFVEAARCADGTSMSFVFKDSQSRNLEFVMGRADAVVPPKALYNRLHVGSLKSEDAFLAARGGKTEKLVLALLEDWKGKHLFDSIVTAAPDANETIRDAKDAAYQRFMQVQQVVDSLAKRSSDVPGPAPADKDAADKSELLGQMYVEAFRAPLELLEATQTRSGGPLALVFTDAQKRSLKLCVDTYLGPTHFDERRLLVGVTRSDDPAAILAASGGKTEKLVLSLLKEWLKEHAQESKAPVSREQVVQHVVDILSKRNHDSPPPSSPSDQGSSDTPSPAPGGREAELESRLAKTTEELKAAMEAQAGLAKDLAVEKETSAEKSKVQADLTEKKAAQIVEAIRAPLELVEAHAYKDGGSLGFVFKDPQSRNLECVLNRSMKDEPSENALASSRYNRLFVGAKSPSDPNAMLTAMSGNTEKRLLALLQEWVKEHIPEKTANELRGRVHAAGGLTETERRNLFVLQVMDTLAQRNGGGPAKKFPRLQFRLITDVVDAHSELLNLTNEGPSVRVSREVLLDESHVKNASAGSDHSIKLVFTDANKFTDFIKKNDGKKIGIVLDGGLYTVVTISAATMNDWGIEPLMFFSGDFDANYAKRLANVINASVKAAPEAMFRQILSDPGDFNVGRLVTAGGPLPLPLYEFLEDSMIHISAGNLAKLQARRAEILPLLKSHLAKLPLSDKNSLNLQQPNDPEAAFNPAEVFWRVDPDALARPLYDMVVGLNAIEVLPELLEIEARLNAEIPTGNDRQQLELGVLHPITSKIWCAQQQQRQVLSTMLQLLRQQRFQPLLDSTFEKTYADFIKARFAKNEQSEFQGIKTPAEAKAQGKTWMRFDPIYQIPLSDYNPKPELPFTLEVRATVRDLAGQFLKTVPPEKWRLNGEEK